jgi:hypothetical protein
MQFAIRSTIRRNKKETSETVREIKLGGQEQELPAIEEVAGQYWWLAPFSTRCYTVLGTRK